MMLQLQRSSYPPTICIHFINCSGVCIEIGIGVDVGVRVGTDVDVRVGNCVGVDVGVRVCVDVDACVGIGIGVDVRLNCGRKQFVKLYRYSMISSIQHPLRYSTFPHPSLLFLFFFF